ncbi:MAG TPA: glycosyltransferase family 1 protein [Candidatus Angelobacter sp.]|jgi:glycosyltransferase involved in cell wall biosynthesis|nr:glycosyltransferase family 1 protein [Candidatus Angelobacter sp.]
MKVAIDVHSIGAQAGGNETFYRQLLQGLTEDQTQNSYTLFYTRAHAPSLVSVDQRFKWVRIPQNPVLRISFALPALLRELKPDVFHCQYILPPRVKCKTVVTIHDLAHERYPQFSPRMEGVRMRRLVPRSARRADRIITVSEHSADDLVSLYGVPRSKITVAYQAPSPRFKPGNKSAAQEELKAKYGISSPFLLYVGRLQARKNLIRMVEAFARVRETHPDLKLVLVGKPDLHHEQLLAKVDELALKEAVLFSGYIASDDLPVFYNAAESFVFPSIFEGFGLPVMESMASGVPTITARGSCLEEIVDDGALLIDPLSVDAITAAITRVLENSDLRRDLIARGLRRSTCFSTAAFAAKVLDAYRSLV